MANIISRYVDGVPETLKDMGDGTYARVVATGGPGAAADQVQGNVAHDAVDSGNPIKIGGKAGIATPSAVAEGDRVDAWFNAQGSICVAGSGNLSAGSMGGVVGFGRPNDAVVLPIGAVGYLYNGVGYDAARGTLEVTLLASAARTATTNSPDQTNHSGRGCHVSINVTVEGAATLALKIQGKHSIGGTYYDIVDFGVVYTAATDAPGTKTVALYPGTLTADHVGVGAGVNGTIGKSAVLPRTWRAVVTHADATTTTYSLAAVTIN